ncbi:MAG: RNA methyltransferase [Clostridia bacterium]|nr:RNA methyltransferase [Clostridia bacterium]
MKNKITARENPIIKNTAKLLKSREERHTQGLFLCEGAVMLEEAVRSGAKIDKVFYREGITLPVEPVGAEIYEVSSGVLEKLSDVKTPQGIVFTVAIPKDKQLRGPHVLAVENLQDPGNVGTVVRTAEAFGIDSVALVGNVADLYSPKTVRSTMGSIFRLNICSYETDAFFEAAKVLELPVYAAALTDTAVPIGTVSFEKAAVMIGNEANGLSEKALDKCDKHVIIPINGIQSLNAAVAASIFMYEMSQSR